MMASSAPSASPRAPLHWRRSAIGRGSRAPPPPLPTAAATRRRRRAAVLVAAAKAAESTTSNPKPQPAAVYLDDAPTRAFIQWAQNTAKITGLGTKVKPATFSGLRGLAATAPAEEGDILLSVPRASAITLPPKRRCPEGVPPGWWDRAPWYARLAALLLLEKRRVGGASSSSSTARPLMAPYLTTLPQSFREMPYYWTDAQLEQLRYPPLQDAVREQRREWRQLHELWVAEAAAGAGAGAGPGGQQQQQQPPPTLAELEWALSAVRSRTFSGPYVASTLASRGRLAVLVAFLATTSALLGGGDADSLGRAFGAAVAAFIFNVLYETTLSSKLKQYVLCPAIDLLNHSSREGSEATYDYFRDSFSVAAASGGVAGPGKQVYGSYGAQSNDSLAQYYGFVERDNPHDVYVLTRVMEWTEEIVGGGGGGGGGKVGAAAAKVGVAAELGSVRVTAAAAGGGFSEQAVAAMRRLLDEVVGAGGGGSADAVLAAVVRREVEELNKGKEGASSGGGGGQKAPPPPPSLAAEFRAEKLKVLEACLERMVAGEEKAKAGGRK